MDMTLSTNLLKAVSKLSWETSLEHSRDYEKLLRFAKKSLVNQGIISCEDLYIYGAERWVNTGLPARFFERLQAYCHCPPPPSGTPPGSESLPHRAPSPVLQSPSAAEPCQPVLRADAAESEAEARAKRRPRSADSVASLPTVPPPPAARRCRSPETIPKPEGPPPRSLPPPPHPPRRPDAPEDDHPPSATDEGEQAGTSTPAGSVGGRNASLPGDTVDRNVNNDPATNTNSVDEVKREYKRTFPDNLVATKEEPEDPGTSSAAVKTGLMASAPDVTPLANTAAPRQGLNANASERADSLSRGLRGEVVEVLQGGTPDASRSDIILEEIETEAEVILQKKEDEYDAVLRPFQRKVDKKRQEQFEFVGTWLATKSGDMLDIPLHGLQITGARTCEYSFVGGELFKGTLEADGMIHWSDGDIWKKERVAEWKASEERSVMRRTWERKAAKARRLDEEAAAEEAEKRAEEEAAARRVAVEKAAARRTIEKLPKRRLLPEELPKRRLLHEERLQPKNYRRTLEETASTTAARRQEWSDMMQTWERKAAKAWRLDEEASAEEAEKKVEAEAAARRVAVEKAAAQRITEEKAVTEAFAWRRILQAAATTAARRQEDPRQPCEDRLHITEDENGNLFSSMTEHQERRYEIQELLEHRGALGNQPTLNDLPEAIGPFEFYGACRRDSRWDSEVSSSSHEAMDGCADYASDLWVEWCSTDNTDDVHYWHPRSGKQQDSPPCVDPEGAVEQLPMIWVRCKDPESGCDYFWKKDTDETLWQLPRLVSEEDMSFSVPSRHRLEETESQEPAPELKALDPAQVLLARAEAAEAEMMSLKSQNAILSEELQRVRQQSQSEREQIVSEERQEARRLLLLDKDRILMDRDRILSEERQQVEQLSFEYGAELEVWRHLEANTVSLHDRPHLHTAAHAMLTEMVPTSHFGPCSRMQNVRILSVQQVTNTAMWRRYIFNRDQVLNQLRNRPRVQKIESICAKATSIKDHLPYKLQLDDLANEVMLLHGTSIETALRICNQGFDDRMARRQLYGRGVYFTVDSCKAAQYCDHHLGSIIVARVVLGDPFIATGPMPNADRPPDVRDMGVPHDSIIVRPGISNSKNKGKGKGHSKSQTHWEFVVPRGDLQVYPEFLITFEYT